MLGDANAFHVLDKMIAYANEKGISHSHLPLHLPNAIRDLRLLRKAEQAHLGYLKAFDVEFLRVGDKVAGQPVRWRVHEVNSRLRESSFSSRQVVRNEQETSSGTWSLSSAWGWVTRKEEQQPPSPPQETGANEARKAEAKIGQQDSSKWEVQRDNALQQTQLTVTSQARSLREIATGVISTYAAMD